MELEIGMGRSHYLFERAIAHPNEQFIGIEWKASWVKQAQARKEREAISNITPIYGNAWLLVPDMFEPDSIDQVTVNFPDPWWKKRHHKRRVLSDTFVDVLISKLKIGGVIFLQTDVAALYDEYFTRLKEHPALVATELNHNPIGARSHREKKCEENGVPIYRAIFTKLQEQSSMPLSTS